MGPAGGRGVGRGSLKLKLWDDAILRTKKFDAKTQGSFAEAVGERFRAGLYMTIPTSAGTSSKRSGGSCTRRSRLPSGRSKR